MNGAMNSIKEIQKMYEKMFQEANIERREIVAKQKEAKQKELISFYKTTDGDGYDIPICVKVYAEWELL